MARQGERTTATDWWRTYFDAQYLLEYEPLFTPERDRREVSRLIDLLGLPTGARILDVPCGQGRHAHLFAEAGYAVDGVDYSRPLLAIAKRRGTGPRLRYTRRDMRALPSAWSGRFDAVLNLFSSFGFFLDPTDDGRSLAEFARVLAPNGVLIWHGGSRDGVMAGFLSRDWWKTENGTIVAHERSFDPLSGVLSVHAAWSGPDGDGARDYRIRLYTATRLAELCRDAGLVVEAAYDGFTPRPLRRRSSEMLLVARKAPLVPRRLPAVRTVR